MGLREAQYNGVLFLCASEGVENMELMQLIRCTVTVVGLPACFFVPKNPGRGT